MMSIKMSPISEELGESSLPLVCFENDVESVINEISPKPKLKTPIRTSEKKSQNKLKTRVTHNKFPAVKGGVDTSKPGFSLGSNSVNTIVLKEAVLDPSLMATVPLSVVEKESSPFWNQPTEQDVIPPKPVHNLFSPVANIPKTSGRTNLISRTVEVNYLPQNTCLATKENNEFKNVKPPEFVHPTIHLEEQCHLDLIYKECENINICGPNNSIPSVQDFHTEPLSDISFSEFVFEEKQSTYNPYHSHENAYPETIPRFGNSDVSSFVWRPVEPIIDSPVESDYIFGDFMSSTREQNLSCSSKDLVTLPPAKVLHSDLPVSDAFIPAEFKVSEPIKRIQDSDLRSLLAEYPDNKNNQVDNEPNDSANTYHNNFIKVPSSFPEGSDSFSVDSNNMKCEPQLKTKHHVFSGRTKSLPLLSQSKSTATSTRCSSDGTAATSMRDLEPLPTADPLQIKNARSSKVNIARNIGENNFSTGTLPVSVERASPVDSSYSDYLSTAYNYVSAESGSDTDSSCFDSPSTDYFPTTSSFDDVFTLTSGQNVALPISGSKSIVDSIYGDHRTDPKRPDLSGQFTHSIGSCDKVSDDDWRLAEATIKAEAIGSNVPLLKEELRYRILQKHGHQRPENWDQLDQVEWSGNTNAKERRRRINRQSAKRCRRKEQEHFLKLRQLYLAEMCKTTELKYEIGRLRSTKIELAAMLQEHLKDCPLEKS